MKYDELDEEIQVGQYAHNSDMTGIRSSQTAGASAFAGTEDYTPSLNDLIRNLANSEWKTRAAAARVLGQKGDHTVLPSLFGMLDDSSVRVRVAVIEALGALGSQTSPNTSVINAIVNKLSDPAWEVREAAAFALSLQGSHIPVSPLIEALSDGDASVRATVVRALGKAGFRTPIEAVVAALNDESGIVREAAVTVLSRLGRRTPVVALISALYDEVECVRLSARQGLANLEASLLIKTVFASYEKAQSGATRALSVCTDLALTILEEKAPVEPIRIILEEAQGQDYRVVKSYLLSRALNELNESTPIEPLLSLLQSNDSVECATAWRMIAQLAQSMLQRRTQIVALVATARDQERMVRIEAEQAIIELVDLALKVLGERMETTHLIAALQGEDRFAAENAMCSLVGQALRVLEEISPLELEPLFAALKHHESLKRAAAAHQLAQRAREAIAERRSPSVPLVISWQNPYRAAPVKLQFGSSLLGQSKRTHMLPWRDFWVPTQDEKPRIAVLSGEQKSQFAVQWN